MKTSQKQLVAISAAFLLGIYGYALVDGIFTRQGVETMRNFYHQGGSQNLLLLLQQLPWLKSLAAAGLQWGILLGMLLLAIRGRSWLERMSELIVSFPRPYFLLILFVLAWGSLLAIFYYKYQFFPRSGDSNAVLFQAKVLAKGMLTVPSHPLREFFNSDWIINNGRMYAQYPLGTSFMMMWGYLLGMPWIINPLLGASGLVFIYFTANELYGELIARYGAIMLLASPLYLDLPTSYLSHTPALFFISVFIYFFIKTIKANKTNKDWEPLAAGMFLGLALNTRPMTAVTMSLPLLCWGGYLFLKERQAFLRKILFFGLGLIPFILGLFWVNYSQNGHPLLFGHTVYINFQPMMGFSTAEYSLMQAVATYFFRLHTLLNKLIYPPVAAGVILVLIALSFMKFKRFNYLLWGFFVLTSLGYLPAITSVWEYRYYYTASLYLLLLLPLGISNLGQWLKENFQLAGASSLLSAFLLVSLLSSLAAAYRSGSTPRAWVRVLRRPYDIAAQAELDNAVVFIRNTEIFYPKWYARNSPEFNDPVLWVRDLGERNQELMAFYPERKAYLYDKGKLTPLPAANE